MNHIHVIKNADSKERLINATLELVWKNSYDRVSVGDICRAADVATGSFYYYFASKADLVLAAMSQAYEKTQQRYESIFSAQNPPLKRFSLLADYIFQSQQEIATRLGHVGGCFATSLGTEIAAQENAVKTKFEEQARRLERFYESTIRELIYEGAIPQETDAKTKAQELYAYLIGHLTIARIENDLTKLRRDLKDGVFQILGLSSRLVSDQAQNNAIH